MSVDGLSDEDVRGVLTRVRRIALVGASANPARPSHGVMAFLLAQGFSVSPVNPGLAGQALLGERVAGSLAEAAPLEMVDIFRASEHVAPVVDAAMAAGAKVIWMQLGVVDQIAAAKARSAGLTVVMDRCPHIEWHRLGLDA